MLIVCFDLTQNKNTRDSMNQLPIELCEKIALYAHPIHPCKNEIDGNPYGELLFSLLSYNLSYNPGYSNARQIGRDVDGSTISTIGGTCYDLAWLDDEEDVMHVFSEHLKSNGNKSKQAHWDVLICLYLAYNQRDAARQERYFNNY